MNENLTPKQEKFIQNIVSGMTQRQAYKEAFNPPNTSDEAIDVDACRLFNNPKVNLRYRELMDKLEDKAIMSARERMIWLTEVVKGIQTNNESEAFISDKMKAIDILNKMSGEYITKVSGDLNVSYEKALKEMYDADEY